MFIFFCFHVFSQPQWNLKIYFSLQQDNCKETLITTRSNDIVLVKSEGLSFALGPCFLSYLRSLNSKRQYHQVPDSMESFANSVTFCQAAFLSDPQFSSIKLIVLKLELILYIYILYIYIEFPIFNLSFICLNSPCTTSVRNYLMMIVGMLHLYPFFYISFFFLFKNSYLY